MRQFRCLHFLLLSGLLVFYLCRAGKLVNYISAPVMGGFISGICTTIILMQVPKLFGGKAGVGELPELVHHIWESRTIFHLSSLLLGVGTPGDSSGVKKADSQISDGSVSDGSGCDRYSVFSSGRSWYSDACSSETGASHMDGSGVWSNPVKRGGDYQSFRGSCHHGRDTYLRRTVLHRKIVTGSMTIRKFLHLPWEIWLLPLPVVVRSMDPYRERLWESSTRRKLS